MSSPGKVGTTNPRLKVLREETPNTTTSSVAGDNESIGLGPDTPRGSELSNEETRNSSVPGSGNPQTPQTPGMDDGDDDVGDEGR